LSKPLERKETHEAYNSEKDVETTKSIKGDVLREAVGDCNM
jgi:hypothetical protein